MILFIKRYFGKDWKFFWTTCIVWEKIVKIPCDFLGLKLLVVSKKLLRIGSKSCSWCGDKQNRNTGLHMSASKKGLRCCRLNKDCDKQPYV